MQSATSGAKCHHLYIFSYLLACCSPCRDALLSYSLWSALTTEETGSDICNAVQSQILLLCTYKGKIIQEKILSHLYTLNNQWLNILWLSVPEPSVTGESNRRETPGEKGKSGFNVWAAGSSHSDPFIYSPLNLSPLSGESSKSDVWSCSPNLFYIHACDAASFGLVLSCCPWPAPASPDGDMRGPFCTSWRLSLSHWQSLHWLLCEPVLRLLKFSLS